MTINKKICRVKTSTIIKSNDTHEGVDNNVAVDLPNFFTPPFQLMMANYLPCLFLFQNE